VKVQACLALETAACSAKLARSASASASPPPTGATAGKGHSCRRSAARTAPIRRSSDSIAQSRAVAASAIASALQPPRATRLA